jgi:hypothetical protein
MRAVSPRQFRRRWCENKQPRRMRRQPCKGGQFRSAFGGSEFVERDKSLSGGEGREANQWAQPTWAEPALTGTGSLFHEELK